MVKDTRVMVQGLLDNAEAGCTPEQISAEIFRSVTGEQVRRVPRFAYRAQIDIIYRQRRLPLLPRDYELERVMMEEKLKALET